MGARKKVECGAKTKGTGKPCKAKVHVQGEHCGLHGGETPAQKKGIAPTLAKDLLARLGEPEPVGDPIRALEITSGRVMALCEALEGMVAKLNGVRYENDHGEQIRGELQMYIQALSRAESINGRIVALGLFERRMRLEEAQAKVWFDVIHAILKDHGVTDVKVPVIRKRLEAIDATCEED